MNEMTITAAQYVQYNNVNTMVKATIDGTEMFVPIEVDNRHYAEIQRQVEAGDLTIADAD
tara:strand:+ start:349 stop:528 length:180 start_codon:yes stop_codon:yes gene_type:complete